MNRDDLLKKCVDRGVADQGSIEAVSHLFYVYLLSALQKGQRVEVPQFGTFGTRVVGVKRARKMPYFEVEKDLADKVNERYRELKYLVVGKYELTAVAGDEEYRGRESQHDVIVDQVGKEMVVDTHRDVTIEEYERSLATSKTKEKKTMPKLNLRGEGTEEDLRPIEEEKPPAGGPALRDMNERGGPSPIVQVLIALVLLALITFGLNYFEVIHLWGTRAPKVTEVVPPPEIAPPPAGEVAPPPAENAAPTTPTPVPIEPPKPSIPATSGTGEFTVQVSSWSTRTKADAEVAKLTGAGLTAFVQEGSVAGERWFRVRVGRYPTEKEAAGAAAKLSEMLENGIWVARMSSR